MTANNTINERDAEVYATGMVFGKIGFDNNIKAACQHKEMMDYMKEISATGSVLPALDGWNRGWAEAHHVANSFQL